MKKITEKQADKLIKRGIAQMFNAPESMTIGFFDAKKGSKKDIVLIITDDGYFTRPYKDLVRGKDEIFVGFKEQGTPPAFEDVFEVIEL